MPSELRFNGKHLEKMGGLIFLAAFIKCIDIRSGTARVLNEQKGLYFKIAS